MQTDKIRTARLLLWFGAFMPIIYTVGKSLDDVGGVGPLDILRGGGGLGLLVLAYLTAPEPARRARNGLPEVGLMLFLAVGLLSALWSVDAKSTLFKMVPLIATYLCAARLASMYTSTADAIKGVVTVAHVIMLGMIVQLVIWPGRAYSSDIAGEESRLHSVLPAISSNILGFVAAIALAGVLLKVGPAWTTRAPVSIILPIIYIAMLIATRSRIVSTIALLMLAVSIAIAMKRSYRAAVVGLITAVIVVLFGWWASTNDRVRDTFIEYVVRGQDSRGLSTLTGRTVLWEKAIPYWEQQPWFGFGYYSGHRLGLPRYDSLFRGYSTLDNTWVESLVNVGIVGVIGLAVYALFGTFRVMGAALDLGPIGAMAVLISVGTVGLTLINPTIQSNTSTLVFFAVVVMATRRTDADLQDKFERVVSAPRPESVRLGRLE